MTKDNSFGNEFERILVSLLAVATGLVLIYLAVQGPLFLDHIRYKTAAVITNQIVGQDLVNLFHSGRFFQFSFPTLPPACAALLSRQFIAKRIKE